MKKKGYAVLIPALMLVAAATEVPAGAMAADRFSQAASSEPSDPPPGGGDMGGMPGMGDPNDPNGGQNGGDNGQATPDPNATDGGQNGGQNGGDNGQATPDPNATDGGQNGGDNGQATADPNDPNGDQNGDGQQNNGQQDNGQNNQGQNNQQNQNVVKQGPNREDFVDIRQAPAKQRAQQSRSGSRGSFNSRCGRNQNQHHNPDNFIVAPGVSNGAHHIHDYVGNLTTDGFSTDQSLAAAGTTCARGDKSAYFWPVMRVRAQQDDSNQAQQSTADGNVGQVATPTSASMTFLGNAKSKVTPMPQFMRVITGDAKSATNGPANAHAQWTCTGFTNRVLTDKYPLCPGRSQVTRVLEFPSCWDGQNTDSANHRTHVVFPDQAGNCPQGTKAVPKLQMTLTYNLPNRALAFAVDTFPEQGHAPVTDHADFENVMPDRLMSQAANCINSGRRC